MPAVFHEFSSSQHRRYLILERGPGGQRTIRAPSISSFVVGRHSPAHRRTMSQRNTLQSLWANANPLPLAARQPDLETFVASAETGAIDSGDENHPPNIVIQRKQQRDPQCVNTQAQRVRVTRWMQAKVAEIGSVQYLKSDAVRQFPNVFRSRSSNANLMKAGRWWGNAETFLQRIKKDKACLSQHSSKGGKRKRVSLKCAPGRGRKTAPWVLWLYPLILAEFSRLKKAGLKFSASVLRLVALDTLSSSPHPTFGPDMSPDGGQLTLRMRINDRWIQQFQEIHNIVHRAQTGKLSMSQPKQQFIDRSVALHMGVLARGFRSGELDENLQENMDETHFCINMDNGRTLGFRGDEEVKYADIVSAGVGITMCVKVTGGVQGRISIPFLIFQNDACSYPIRGTPDNCPGVCYRTTKKGFMTSQVLLEYYKERRVLFADPGGRKKIQWVDNAPGHKITSDCEAALDSINTELRFFPENSTHLTQPCDSFVISKIKDAWTTRWEAKKLTMLREGRWQGDGRVGTSGMLQNPGKKFFLELAAASVRDVNGMLDKRHSISYARKAMIRCGLSLNVTGQWEETQLSKELQEILKKYRRNFDGFYDGLDGLDLISVDVVGLQSPVGAPVDIQPVLTDLAAEIALEEDDLVSPLHNDHIPGHASDFAEESGEHDDDLDNGAHPEEEVYLPTDVHSVGETMTQETNASGLDFFQ